MRTISLPGFTEAYIRSSKGKTKQPKDNISAGFYPGVDIKKKIKHNKAVFH